MKLLNMKSKHCRSVSTIILMFLTLTFSIAGSARETSSDNLDALKNSLEQLRQDLHIPGMALVIVKDDEVIFAEGFGFANIENNIPVTPKTNFAIGSTTKAFTSTLIAMMNDDKKMSWDEEVTTYIDWFRPNLGENTGLLTIRDMLSNRSGLSRNDILWANGQVSREDILKEAMKALPSSAFREKFNYNNVLFLASGLATANAAEADSWDSLLQKRILGPLNMSTSSSINDQVKNLALGYQWDNNNQRHELLSKRNLDNIAPAGGLHSNAIDMANWLRLNLNKGEFEGHRLVSVAQFEQLWRPAISLTTDYHYGLGWFIRDWKGNKVVEHGGNIQGYSAQVALMPDKNIGFALLTNVSMTPLQEGSMDIIWSSLLDEPQQEIETLSTTDLATYTGRYLANFGPFKDVHFSVQVNSEGDLSVDVPGQRVYVLNPPNESGKWYFKLTDTIAVSFDVFENGQHNLMRLHQNGMNFELLREGFSPQPETNIEELTPLVGRYHHDNLSRPLRVLISNGRLAVDVPEQMVYELELPNSDGFRHFRISNTFAAKFTIDSNGIGEAVSIFRNGQKQITAERVATNSQKTLPSLEELLVLMKSEEKKSAYEKWGATTITADVSMKQAGISGQMLFHYQEPNMFAQHFDFGRFGKTSTVLNGSYAATKGPGPYKELKGIYLEQVKAEHPRVNVDWLSYYDSINVVDVVTVSGRKAYSVELVKESLPLTTVAIDSATGDILERRGRVVIEDVGTIPITVTFDDFQMKDGVRIPFRANVFTPANGNMLIEYTSIETEQQFSSDVFTLQNK